MENALWSGSVFAGMTEGRADLESADSAWMGLYTWYTNLAANLAETSADDGTIDACDLLAVSTPDQGTICKNDTNDDVEFSH